MGFEIKHNEVEWKIHFGSLDMFELTGNQIDDKFFAHIKPRLDTSRSGDLLLPATAENIEHAVKFLVDHRQEIYNFAMRDFFIPVEESEVIHYLQLVKCSDNRVWNIEVSYFNKALFNQKEIKDQLKPFDQMSHDLIRNVIEELKGRGEKVKNFRPYDSDCEFKILKANDNLLTVRATRNYYLETTEGLHILHYLKGHLDRTNIADIKLKNESVRFKITGKFDINLQGENHG